MKEKKLLIIYYNFPPVKVPGAVRLRNFYEQSRKYFSQIHVVTSSNRRSFLQDPSLDTTAKCCEVPAYDLRRFVQIFRKGESVQISQKAKSSPFYKVFSKLRDSFPFNLFLDDGNISYIYLAYRKAKKIIEDENITHILSTFRPYSDHMVAYLLKKKFPHLIWIADFRDLHVDPANSNVFKPQLQQKINSRILKRANLITTVSKGLKQQLLLIHPNIFVLYNGIRNISCKENNLRLPSTTTFTILYTGSLFKEKRRPHLLFKVLKNLLQEHPYSISIAYAGRDEMAWKKLIEAYQLEDIAQYHGFVSHSRSQQLQKESHVNLLLTYTHKELYGNITSKTFEYLAAKKPVLAIINGPTDKELEDIFCSTNAGIITYDNADFSIEYQKIRTFLIKYYNLWQQNHSLDSEINQAALTRYSWSYQFEAFMHKLSNEEI
jgi:hypothetical protein